MKDLVKEGAVVEITARELQIVQLLSNGNSSKMVAQTLKVNIRTMEAAIIRLKTKTDTKTVPHLVATFIRKKLIN
jgi:DNA-binding CsgD family transcriptional regulator